MRYYSTQRPVMPGSYPKKGALEIHNFDCKTYCKEIGREAWGYIDYADQLTEPTVQAYELTQSGMKKYWCVTMTVDDKGGTTAAITKTVESDIKPENRSVSTRRKDIYNDWFESREEAQAFVEEAKRE